MNGKALISVLLNSAAVEQCVYSEGNLQRVIVDGGHTVDVTLTTNEQSILFYWRPSTHGVRDLHRLYRWLVEENFARQDSKKLVFAIDPCSNKLAAICRTRVSCLDELSLHVRFREFVATINQWSEEIDGFMAIAHI